MSVVTLALWIAGASAADCAVDIDSPTAEGAAEGDVGGGGQSDECAVSSATRTAEVAEQAYPSMLFNLWTVLGAGAYTSLISGTGAVLWFGWMASGFWDLRGLFGGIALCTCGWLGGCVSIWLLRGVFLREAIDRGYLDEDPFPLGARPAAARPASGEPGQVPY